MPFIVSAKGGAKYPPITEGVHIGTCISIVDLGMQVSDYQGEQKEQRKLRITWEIPGETIDVEGEEKPRNIGKEYTNSLNEKATLRSHLEAWRGKKFTDEELEGFDLEKLLGKSCQLQILHGEGKNGTYAAIASVMALPKGMKVEPPSTEPFLFSLEDPEFLGKMARLPDWLADKVRQSPTYQDILRARSEGPASPEESWDEDSQDLPF